jgi:hypothetical protein
MVVLSVSGKYPFHVLPFRTSHWNIKGHLQGRFAETKERPQLPI